MYIRKAAALVALALVLSLSSGNANQDTVIPVVPLPVHVERTGGSFAVSDSTSLVFTDSSEELRRTMELFSQKMEARHGVKVALDEARQDEASCTDAVLVGQAVINCGLSDELPDVEVHFEEGYRLSVTENAVLVDAMTAHGYHNAMMTLLQLADAGDGTLPGVRIADWPRFNWRGLMLDPARMFIPPEMTKRHIDMISELKMNVFHWHLTDDQGWRIESDTYPRLHEVGGDLKYQERDKKRALDRHGWGRDGRGYYTKDEIRDIVSYAAERHVMVVPEIDMPGHTSAWLAAYPELSCSGKGAPVRRTALGIFPTALCPGKEEVYEFIDNLFAEVLPLFPSPYVHIGSDEVVGADWMDYGPNREILDIEDREGKDGLQAYFVGRVASILKKHGKTMIGWDEIGSHIPVGAVLQAWRSHNAAREAAGMGHHTIVSLMRPHYLNYSPFMHTMKRIYTFDPVPEGLPKEREAHVLGGEACLWGRQPNISDMEIRLYPRLLAQAEALWTALDRRDWDGFLERIDVIEGSWRGGEVRFGPTYRDPLRY